MVSQPHKGMQNIGFHRAPVVTVYLIILQVHVKVLQVLKY